MPRRLFLFAASLLAIATATMLAIATTQNSNNASTAASVDDNSATVGALAVVDTQGRARALCPLKHTAVRVEITGFLSRVTVTQEFENTFKEKIEAVYTFPLPPAAAVDDMTMLVGDRTVRGRIMRREQARGVYEAARAGGQVASLLDQERPNVFTQSVANIMPGEKVIVTISYVERLKYEDGLYEFSFPMVVGPRYIPGTATETQSGGVGGDRVADTNRVPDASHITPPVAAPGARAGHDISLEVTLDAGVPLGNLKSTTHEVDIEKIGVTGARVRLKNRAEIPNKDFVLRYTTAGRKIEDAILTHRASEDGRGGYFTLILQPPERVAVEDVTPKELIFVLDTSGSMEGFPIEKAKEAMKYALDGLYPQDTFNLITFAGDTHILFSRPVPATRENLARAQKFLAAREGSGGTEMMKAIRAALDPSDAQSHIRIVCFMTDGYVGDDMEIIGEVRKHQNARVFSFGIGSSVNRFLLDKMAEDGRGEVEYVSLNDDGSAAAKRFHERIRNPLLTDISIDWAGLPVADVYPKRIPDLFSAKPVILTGRYTGGGKGVVRLRGRISGNAFEREIFIELPESELAHDVLATLWARTRIDDLMSEDMAALQRGHQTRPDLTETITQLGIEYRLMTQFTSFVAVEEMTVTDGGQPRRIEVPVEMPEGVNLNAALGGISESVAVASKGRVQNFALLSAAPPVSFNGGASGIRSASGARRERAKSAPTSRPVSSADAASANTVVAQSEELAIARRDEKLLSLEEMKRRRLIAKLHPSLAALIERLKSRSAPAAADEAKFVRDGKATVQLWLVDKSPEVLEKLKGLGFEVMLDPKTSKFVIGRLAVERLAALAELAEVRYVAPQAQTPGAPSR